MKKIITILTVLLSLQFAYALTNTTNFNSQGVVNVSAGDYGLTFVANQNTTITAVTKKSTTLATNARILSSSFVELGTASFTGDTATFGTAVPITTGATYYVLINNGANNFATDYGTVSADLPSVNGDITFPLTNNAVFKTPYSQTVPNIVTNGGNQLGITGIITGGTTPPVEPPVTPPTSSDPRVLFLGDSLTEGIAVANPYSNLIVTPPGYTKYNMGISSTAIATINAQATTVTNPQMGANKADDVVVVWAGSVDLYQAVGTSNAITTFNNLKAYCLYVKSLGSKVVVVTMLPRPNNTVVFSKTEYLAYNALIRAHWTEFADELADVQTDSRIGTDASNYDTTYYADLVHLTQAGYTIVASYVQDALNRVDSNFPGSTPVTPPVLTVAQRLLNAGFTQTHVDILLEIFMLK